MTRELVPRVRTGGAESRHSFSDRHAATFVVPVLIVGVALFDTTLVSITRLLHGRTPFQGGLDHVSHRLVFVGLSTRAAVCLLYSVAVALGFIALVITRVDRTAGLALTGLVALFALVSGILLALVPCTGRLAMPEHQLRGPDPSPSGSQVRQVHTRGLAVRGNASGHRRPPGGPEFSGPRRGAR